MRDCLGPLDPDQSVLGDDIVVCAGVSTKYNPALERRYTDILMPLQQPATLFHQSA
jgi:hypothetical protein